MRVIGLMSGTSLDGVDAAWLETDGEQVGAFGPALTIPYEPALRAVIRELLDLAPTLVADDPQLLAVSRRLTEVHADAVRALDAPYDLIGFHGQTILHEPQRRRTWQIGDAAWLAKTLGRPVAYDFRSADVAAGGEGAPLVPLFHSGLAAALPKPLAILNIGGVANVTYLGADGSIAACDTGPGNALLDDWVQQHTGQAFDADGRLAAEGKPDADMLRHWLSHSYFERELPKSLDRLSFHALLDNIRGMSASDGAATLAAFTAAAVAATRLPQRPQHWLITGGGRRNPAIMAALARTLAVPVNPVESVGWDGDFLEAQCFAYLAMRVKRGLPLSLPMTTGVPLPMQGGQIQP
ncbi:anhydro-N-acetylmuramic acid kinase [Acidisoma cellulosilytica]|uniref:Anhydro-N-acetylmuramic acid kinase n=1 Tax=Acidisoma cellulosilyticum TaxID=2802395 RepID=A0A963YZJ9_9PROT|nr:anhydro-N-acetylmuramic acid kinase [Acidisoma cellulosilyticum]MCB8879083.1 anhydro-N-acetylmuramic acid kinase [Acidisoma cellulosilyticum]